MHKITLWPTNKVHLIDENSTLLEVFHRDGVSIRSSCGGYATCGECLVKVVSGEDNLVPPAFDEIKILGNVFHITKERLACQCRIRGDISVDMAAHNENIVKAPKKMPPKKVMVKKKGEERVYPKEEPTTPKTEVKPKLGGNRRPKFFDTDTEKKSR